MSCGYTAIKQLFYIFRQTNANAHEHTSHSSTYILSIHSIPSVCHSLNHFWCYELWSLNSFSATTRNRTHIICHFDDAISEYIVNNIFDSIVPDTEVLLFTSFFSSQSHKKSISRWSKKENRWHFHNNRDDVGLFCFLFLVVVGSNRQLKYSSYWLVNLQLSPINKFTCRALYIFLSFCAYN